MDEAEILRRLGRLAELQPPEDATARALSAVRARLATQVDILRSPTRRLHMVARYSAIIAATLALAIGTWLLLHPGRGNRAFADVQDRVGKTRSLTMTFTSTEADAKPMTGTGYFLSDGRMRLVEPDGSYVVI